MRTGLFCPPNAKQTGGVAIDAQSMAEVSEVRCLALADVRPDPEQHRRYFDPEALVELAESIRSEGQKTPIVVRPDPQGEGYMIVAGERRYRALASIGAETVFATVREGVSEVEAVSEQALENLARVDPRPCEEGRAYRRIIDALRAEKPWLSEDDARKRAQRVTGATPQKVCAKLKLLELPEDVQAMVDRRELGERHALELLRLTEASPANEAELQRQARKARAQGSSLADVKARVMAYLGEQAQCSLFGADEAKATAEARKTRDTLGRVVGHLERVADLTFDERQQALALGELRADELAATRAKLAGAAKHLGALLAEVDAARGSEGPVSVGSASDGLRTPARGIPEALRLEVRGAWLWLYGTPPPNGDPLTRDLYLAGAVWSSRRGAWYAPDEERGRRVAAAVEGYRQNSTPGVGQKASAQCVLLPETQREVSA